MFGTPNRYTAVYNVQFLLSTKLLNSPRLPASVSFTLLLIKDHACNDTFVSKKIKRAIYIYIYIYIYTHPEDYQ